MQLAQTEFGEAGRHHRLDDLWSRDPGGQHGSRDASASVRHEVAATDLDRIEVERFGQAIHLHLGDERTLGSTEPSKRATGNGGGVDRERVDVDVRHLVGPDDTQVGVSEDLVRRVVVRASVEPDRCFGREQAAVGIGRRAGVDLAPVTLVVADDRSSGC